MQLRFLSWSRGVFLAGVALLILFILPVAWFPLQLGKLTAFFFCLIIAAILLVCAGAIRKFFTRPGALLACAMWLLPLVYLLSWRFSVDRFISWSGYAIDSDTVLFTLLCALAFSLSFVLIRSAYGGRLFLRVLATAVALAALFQIVVIVFGQRALPLAIFSDRSINMVGKWNDLGLVVGLLLILLLGWLHYSETSIPRRVGGALLALLCVCLLGVIQFSLVWWLVLVGCALLAGRSILAGRHRAVALPWVPIVGGVIAIGFLIGGAAFSSYATNIFPVSSLEVRPSFASTLSIAQMGHAASTKSLLLGTGPNTFAEEWLLQKPPSVSQSLFWDVNFTVGFSTLLTVFESVGVLGVLAWLVPLLLVLSALVRLLRTDSASPVERTTALTLAFVTGYWWSTFIFYVPSESLVLLGFISAGASVAVSMGAGRPLEQQAALGASTRTRLARLASVIGALLCLGFILWFGFVIGQRFIAEALVNQGTILLSQQQLDTALALATRSENVETTPDVLNFATQAGYAKLQALSTNTTPTPAQQQTFLSLVKSTIASGQENIKDDPQDYRSYISLGQVYELLASIGVSGAYQNALETYQQAAAKDPAGPDVALSIAQLAASQNDTELAQQYLSRALELKPDYTNAIVLQVQLDVAKNDIPSAIAAAQSAIETSPSSASLWFELGLLYYSKGDTADAMLVLEQAVKLQSNYANAQYFLGLSYAVQGRLPDAIAQFEDLAKTNPNNAEISLILNNLKAGKPPFTGAQPPVSTAPQTGGVSPISQ
jgi:tetratricopeptide (TPR) repeat protein